MSYWSKEELAAIRNDDNLYISIPSADGSMHKPTWIWIVVSDDGDVYSRAYNGTSSRWYAAAKATGHGHLSVGGIEKDVKFEFPIDDSTNDSVDEAYASKYAGSTYLEPMLGVKQRAATVKFVPLNK